MTDTTSEPLLSGDFLKRLQQLEISAKKILAGRMKGDRLSKRKGRGSEFADYRPYTVGDDLRFLDWNLYGRVEKLFLRLYREEEDLHIYLFIDNSKSMAYGSPTKLRYAKQVAAALGFVGLANMDRIVIETVGNEKRLPQFRGRPSLWRMMKALDSIEATENPVDLNTALRGFSQRAKGQGVALILSDFMDKDGYEEGLKFLAARNLDVYAIQILAEEEIHPPFTGDLKLTDLEDGDEAEVTISAPLLARYEQTLAAFRGKLSQFCSKRGMSYLFTSNQVPFEKLVLGYLRNRGLLK
ncbi:MAG: DUF58 domain-containing protein [Fimbriiglobus sp.]